MARRAKPLQTARCVGSLRLARALTFALLQAAGVSAALAGGFEGEFESLPPGVLITEDSGNPAPGENAVVDQFHTSNSSPMDPGFQAEAFPESDRPSAGRYSSTATISDFGDENPGGGVGWSQDQQNCFTTKVRSDAILMFRGPPANRPLFTTFDPVAVTTGPTVLNSSQLGSDPLAAPRIAVERSDACGRGIEGVFLYAGNFYAHRELPFVSQGYALAAPGIYGNTWGVSAPPLDSAQATLLSNLYSAEVNLRSATGLGSTRFLAGFRWIQWGENFRLTDQFTDPVLPDSGVDFYRTNCINNLYGGQIGLDTLLWNRGDGFRVESVVKAGAYYNAASQSSAYDYSTTSGFAFSRAIAVNGAGSCSFVGEVGLTAVVPLRNNLDLRCGYFGLWLDSIAQPVNQLSGQTLTQIDDPAGTLNTAGTVVLQGLTLGLEGRW